MDRLSGPFIRISGCISAFPTKLLAFLLLLPTISHPSRGASLHLIITDLCHRQRSNGIKKHVQSLSPRQFLLVKWDQFFRFALAGHYYTTAHRRSETSSVIVWCFTVVSPFTNYSINKNIPNAQSDWGKLSVWLTYCRENARAHRKYLRPS